MTKGILGKLRFFYCAILFFLSFSLFCFALFCLSLYFHITVFKESQDRTSAGTCSQRLKERLWRNAAYWDAPCSLLSKFFYSSQPMWPGWHIPEWVSCLPISASNWNMATKQFDRDSSSIEILSSKVTLLYVKLTKLARTIIMCLFFFQSEWDDQVTWTPRGVGIMCCLCQKCTDRDKVWGIKK